jgi:hypothetical protein
MQDSPNPRVLLKLPIFTYYIYIYIYIYRICDRLLQVSLSQRQLQGIHSSQSFIYIYTGWYSSQSLYVCTSWYWCTKGMNVEIEYGAAAVLVGPQ